MIPIFRTQMRKEIINLKHERIEELLRLRSFLESIEEPLYGRDICNLYTARESYSDTTTYQKSNNDRWYTSTRNYITPTISLSDFIKKYSTKPKYKTLKE